jgi:hypothetical protein
MRLPSVLNELNINPNSYSENELTDRCESTKKSINIYPEFSIINNKISIIEQKYENVSYTLDRILQKLDTLNADIKMIKETKPVDPKPVDPKQVVSDQKNNTFIKPSIVSACENENIKFEINDSDDSSCDECEANKSKEEEVEDDKIIPENLLRAGQYAKYLMNKEEEVEDDKEEEEDDKEEEEVEDDKEEEEV